MGEYRHYRGYEYRVIAGDRCYHCNKSKGSMMAVFSHWYYCSNAKCRVVYCPDHGSEYAVCPKCGGTIMESA